MEKLIIFIDGYNLYKSLNRLKRKKIIENDNIDFIKLGEVLSDSTLLPTKDEKLQLIRIYYYDCPKYQFSNPTPEQREIYQKKQKALEILKSLPLMKVRLGHLVRRNGNFIEKGVDIKIASDMLSLAFNNAYDIAILISGDADFEEVIDQIQRLGKQVFNAGFKGYGDSEALKKICDGFIDLIPTLDKIVIKTS